MWGHVERLEHEGRILAYTPTALLVLLLLLWGGLRAQVDCWNSVKENSEHTRYIRSDYRSTRRSFTLISIYVSILSYLFNHHNLSFFFNGMYVLWVVFSCVLGNAILVLCNIITLLVWEYCFWKRYIYISMRLSIDKNREIRWSLQPYNKKWSSLHETTILINH